jgi:serine protease Do
VSASRPISVIAALAAALMAGCAFAPSAPVDAGTGRAAGSRSAAPPGFSDALRASLPSVLGVYGLARAEGVGHAARPPRATAPTRGEERSPWSAATAPANIGAGFFIDEAGTFVTAAHVVEDAGQVLVKTADSGVFVAELIGRDEEADVALLRLGGMTSTVPGFGRSTASRPGDWVLAIGEPFGLHRSAVVGIVAGPTRHFSEDGDSFYIQADLSLNPGNSGGPLVNAAGEVIGMNLRMVVGPSGSGGFSLSIPIEAVLQIAAELRSVAQQRPRLGAGFEDVSAPVALSAGRRTASGALITSLREGSVGRRMGLQLGDIVVGADGRPIEDSGDFARWLMSWRSVSGTRIVVWRERGYQLLATP